MKQADRVWRDCETWKKDEKMYVTKFSISNISIYQYI